MREFDCTSMRRIRLQDSAVFDAFKKNLHFLTDASFELDEAISWILQAISESADAGVAVEITFDDDGIRTS